MANSTYVDMWFVSFELLASHFELKNRGFNSVLV